jgi:hypothetical protein
MTERVIAHNDFNTLTGKVISTRNIGGTTLVTIELDGTTSSVEVDDADFTWYSIETEEFPLKRFKAGELSPTLRVIDLAHDSESIDPMNPEVITDQVHEANSVCSDQRIGYQFGWNKDDTITWDPTNTHKLMIDIDVPAYLLPSSTPGHSHLYIDKDMDKEEWLALLIALRNAGIIESGYVGASIQRGYTALRLPWVSKRSGTDAMVG